MNTETQPTFTNDRQKSEFEALYKLEAILLPEVKRLGLESEVTRHNRDRSDTYSDYRLRITHPEFKDFCASVTCRDNMGKGSLWFDTERLVRIDRGTFYPDGLPQWHHDRHNFDSHVNMEELQAIGIEGTHCRIPSLSKEFKLDKNPKLIVRDVVPRLEQYLALVRLVSPRIDAALNRGADALALQNRWYPRCDYPHGELKELKTRRMTFTRADKRYSVEFSEYGGIEVTLEVTEQELAEMLNEKI